MSRYANAIVDKLDPNHLISYRYYREDCTFVGHGFVKDIAQLGRDLKDVIILDNAPISYTLQPFNALPSYTWVGDKSDTQLHDLLFILKALANVDDVREYLRKIVKSNKIDYEIAFKLFNNNSLSYKQITPERKVITHDVKPKLYRASHKQFDQSSKRIAATDGFKGVHKESKTPQKKLPPNNTPIKKNKEPKTYSEKKNIKPPRYPNTFEEKNKSNIEYSDNRFYIKRKTNVKDDEVKSNYGSAFIDNTSYRNITSTEDMTESKPNTSLLSDYNMKVNNTFDLQTTNSKIDTIGRRPYYRNMTSTYDKGNTNERRYDNSDYDYNSFSKEARYNINDRINEDLYRYHDLPTRTSEDNYRYERPNYLESYRAEMIRREIEYLNKKYDEYYNNSFMERGHVLNRQVDTYPIDAHYKYHH